jgi:hypothetical protein
VSSARLVRCLVVVVAVLAPACDSAPAEPPAEFPFATATAECGPADGPAVAVYLLRDSVPAVPPGGPHVQLYVWHGLDELEGRPWTVGGSSTDGFAEYQDGMGAATPLHGTVTVTAVRADSITGDVDLASEGVFRVRGGFRAVWIPRVVMCG